MPALFKFIAESSNAAVTGGSETEDSEVEEVCDSQQEEMDPTPAGDAAVMPPDDSHEHTQSTMVFLKIFAEKNMWNVFNQACFLAAADIAKWILIE